MIVSACIICCNEEKRIAAVLHSLAWCGDIVIVDSGSTDSTLDIARNHATVPRIVSHPWQGFNNQRKFAAEQCRHPWVLMLDADEECSPELAREIQAMTDDGVTGMFLTPRDNYFGGKYMRCWSPDDQQRLIHRERIEWDAAALPEGRHVIAGFAQKRTRGALLHRRHDPLVLSDIANGRKLEMYAQNLSETMFKRGKRATLAALITRPLATFIKYYVIKGGFRDGRLGLVVALKSTVGVILKYSALYVREVNREEKK